MRYSIICQECERYIENSRHPNTCPKCLRSKRAAWRPTIAETLDALTELAGAATIDFVKSTATLVLMIPVMPFIAGWGVARFLRESGQWGPFPPPAWLYGCAPKCSPPPGASDSCEASAVAKKGDP